MTLTEVGRPLVAVDRLRGQPGPHQVLIKVHACGVCRTDLHLAEGDLRTCKLPIVPGHEIVGQVVELGPGVERLHIGARVGVPWLGWTCGHCRYCREGHENLCPDARFTGCQIDGGFADLTLADERYCFSLPERYGDAEAAPLLCAGLIGYRALCMAEEAKTLGLYGFGAAAHIIAQVAKQQGRRVFAFTRPSDLAAQRFAVELGCDWAGSSTEMPPALLDAALIFAPVGELVPAALRATDKGGSVICAGIHMSEIPSFPYRILWEERTLRSVANLTRTDAEGFLALAARMPIRTYTEAFALADANMALSRLKRGELRGAAVLVP